ncbi:hypothetical protein ACQ5SI_23845 [Peribacillus frigoritolerans]|uniref:hypothetical protein n=1 Tax=Peribacillus frigoritolerans TaxID=450367 RepID=UPI003D34B113
MDVYIKLASELLTLIESNQKKFIWNKFDNKEIGFVYRGYNGLMARVDEKYIKTTKSKQGYYDIFALTGPWDKLTHDTLLNLIYENCTLKNCERIWRGESPTNLDLKPKSKAILYALTLLMFEQEVNFGKQEWQRWSQFNPDTEKPYWRRPRDLFMGYINMVFDKKDVSCIDSFKNSKGLLLPPTDKEIRKKYFEVYENDQYAQALMSGNTLELFNISR